MKYQFISIERQYASGGTGISEKLAQELGIPCYGRQILELTAKECGTPVEYLEKMEEKATNSLLYSIAAMARISSGQGEVLSGEDKLYRMECDTITRLAAEGPAIFVGHCSVDILREKGYRVLHVYLHADKESRIRRAVEEYGVDPKKLDTIMRRNDVRRAQYYGSNTGRKWNDISQYDIALDTGSLGIDTCVAILKECMK